VYLSRVCWIVLTHLVRSTAAGDRSRTTIQGPNGPEDVPNYALVQGIFIGVVAAYVIILTLIGPENHGSHFERAKTAFEPGASKEDVNSILPGNEGVRDVERSSSVGSGDKEKAEIRHVGDGGRAKDGVV
jgi:SHS family lactate transporter-like MFS transporter